MNNFAIAICFCNLNNETTEKVIYNFDTLKEVKDLYMRYKSYTDIKIINYELYELKTLQISLD